MLPWEIKNKMKKKQCYYYYCHGYIHSSQTHSLVSNSDHTLIFEMQDSEMSVRRIKLQIQ